MADIQVVELAKGAYAVLAPEGLANGGFIVRERDVLVVDTLMLPSQTRAMLEAIRRVTDRQVRFLVNTHVHGDHVFGNELFPPPAEIIAHEMVRARMLETGDEMIARFVRMRPEHKQEFEAVSLAPPSLTFTGRMTLHEDGRRIELVTMAQGHTDGDTVVYLPEERVLFAGDFLFSGTVPAVLPEASSAGWIRGLEQIEALDVDRVVPGHGPLSTKRELGQMREYLAQARAEIGRAVEQGLSVEQAVAAVRMDKYTEWDKQERLPTVVQNIYQELAGTR